MGDLLGLCPSIDPRGYIYVLPNAPIPVQVGFGATGYAWCMPLEGTPEGLKPATTTLSAFFTEVACRYNAVPGQVVLGGFSQGGMMAYVCGLVEPDLFGGLIALSAWIPDPDGIRTGLQSSKTLPIFIAHGVNDTLISIENARQCRQLLDAEGYGLHYREYEMGHEIGQDVLDDLNRWLPGVVPPASGG